MSGGVVLAGTHVLGLFWSLRWVGWTECGASLIFKHGLANLL